MRTLKAMQALVSPPPSRHAALSADQATRFFDLGWLVLPGLFRQREVLRMQRAFERLARRAANLTDTGDQDGSRFILDRKGPEGSVRVHRVVWCGASETVLE